LQPSKINIQIYIQNLQNNITKINLLTAVLLFSVSFSLTQYLENKFDGDFGVLARKHIQANDFVYIGKEANNIEDQPLDVIGAQVFVDEKDIRQKILALTPEEARKLGISIGAN